MADAHPSLPDLDRLRRDAKRLRRALIAGDAEAQDRFAAAFEGRRAPGRATHADCLHMLAREAGAESWPRLKLAAETAAMTLAERRSALGAALFHGAFHRVDRLLALDPTLPEDSLPLLLALAREEDAMAALTADPEATRRTVADRRPIHHLCFSQIARREPAAPARQIRLLDALIAAGADVNDGMPAEPGSEHTLSPLYGALGHAANLPLAEALLARGADPDDNESLYHATELEDLAAVRLLFAHGATVGTTNAFLRMLDRESPEGVRLFLDNGADPNAPPYRHPDDEPAEARNALHHAILRGRSGEIGAMLIEAGADAGAPHDGKSAYALARVSGNASMAAMLEARGLATALSPPERFLACLAEADEAGARAALAAAPDLRAALTERDLTRQTELAMRAEALPVLKAMAALGFDPDRCGEAGMPPIHAAAWWGHAETVDLYLTLGADLDIENDFGGDALGAAIHGSANCPGRAEGDYERVVGALVGAGARIRPEKGHLAMGSEAVSLLVEALAGARDPL
jgi:ankyrin repeat protein